MDYMRRRRRLLVTKEALRRHRGRRNHLQERLVREGMLRGQPANELWAGNHLANGETGPAHPASGEFCSRR
jgi:hypothetical protein